jgi:amino acid adenylation domain-containing protein
VIEEALQASQAPEYGGAASPEGVAYLLYTSGSTGKPKGVAQNHRNVLHFIAAYTNNLRLGPEDRLSLLPSYSVDAGVMDIYGALLNGATLCPIDVRAAGLDGACRRLVRDGITVYHSTPTLYRHIARELSRGRQPERARLVVLGGEEVRGEDVAAFRRAFGPDCVLVNGFGPTESTVSLQYFVDPERDADRRSVPIGYPVERTAVTLLSRGGRPGQVCGEIAIRSPHVALEYWRNAEGTRAVFLADPAGGRERIYKTGDMGRLLPDGTLEFRGRRDLQTKIQGFRVEIGEVEAALAQHPGIKEVAATVWEPAPGEKRLVAHFVAPPGSAPSQDELRRFLRRRLPVHMIPAAFVRIDAIPLTPSGKVDRLSLPAPELAQAGSGAGAADAADPSDPVERNLAEIWKRVLGVERVGTRDDFFELGGHSIVALRMMAEVERDFGVNLPLATLFESPTIERLADVVRAEAVSAQPPSAVPIPTTTGFASPFVRALAERLTAVLRR